MTLLSMQNLVTIYDETGRHHGALLLVEQALCKQEQISGDENPDTLGTTRNLAVYYHGLGRKLDATTLGT